MASEYKKRGGGYNTDKRDRDASQKHLSQWTEEEWQTKEGSGSAKQDDGTEKRYLPKKAWENMNEREKKETDEKKLEESREGKQFVQNTGRAKKARGKASKEVEEGGEKGDKDDDEANGEDHQGLNGKEEADKSEQEEDQKQEQTGNTGQKRGRGRPKNDDESRPNKKGKTKSAKGKKSKTVGSKHDSADAPAEQASAERLPSEGQTVHWKALPGWVEGIVVEIVYESKDVEGKAVKAKEDDPRIVMKSNNGKIAVHKPQAVYFN